MNDPIPDCPRCKGAGFYLVHEGQGYLRDGSFDHNEWRDCLCIDDCEDEDLENDQ